MSWTDKASLMEINTLRQDLDAKYLVETGTFRGSNALYWSQYFKQVFTCENDPDQAKEAYEKRVKYLDNAMMAVMDSYLFVRTMKNMLNGAPTVYYLDAHFYNPDLPKEKRFAVKDELRELENTENCAVIIHDYDNGELGHITYDGIPIGWNLVGDLVQKVNPNFYYYTNTKQGCDPITMDDINSGTLGLDKNEDYQDTVDLVWSNDEKKYRGFLFCSPIELDLSKYSLIQYKP